MPAGRRVRRDHQLAAGVDELTEPGEQREAALHRQGGLGLVQQIQPVWAEPVHDQVEERLPVGAFMR
ncbi:MAG: hypothetical protein ACRDQA_29980 [Nocardioidaceae bacterium]